MFMISYMIEYADHMIEYADHMIAYADHMIAYADHMIACVFLSDNHYIITITLFVNIL